MCGRALVVGNWKMNGVIQSAQSLTDRILEGFYERVKHDKCFCEVVLCPPFTGLWAVRLGLGDSGIKLGGQTMSEQVGGPFTGEICAAMLRNVGCHYVILGHSERRTLFGETDALVARKMAAAFRDKLEPIVCLGESLQERDAGRTLEVVAAQLMALFPYLPEEESKRQQLVLAYEPVWAIGTGYNATPDQVQEVHGFIRQQLRAHVNTAVAAKIRIIYGGSVKPNNASEIFSQEDVDGGLIGGASLDASDFLAIMDAYPRKS